MFWCCKCFKCWCQLLLSVSLSIFQGYGFIRLIKRTQLQLFNCVSISITYSCQLSPPPSKYNLAEPNTTSLDRLSSETVIFEFALFMSFISNIQKTIFHVRYLIWSSMFLFNAVGVIWWGSNILDCLPSIFYRNMQ